MTRYKLSASALSTYLRSPKMFYWRHVRRLEPAVPSVGSFDHDKLAGVLWAAFVDRFYKGMGETENTDKLLADWQEQTDGWVAPKTAARLRDAMSTWATTYYQMFAPDDGCRKYSELRVENETFIGFLDGLSEDGVIHEVKSTSRSPQLVGQLWKVQNSVQVKLYAVLTQAKGACIEFAWKDAPYAVFRAPVVPITPEQLVAWEQELNALATTIYSLGDDPNNYPCHPDGCCMVSKGFTAMCPYDSLCDMGLTTETEIGYKSKSSRQ